MNLFWLLSNILLWLVVFLLLFLLLGLLRALGFLRWRLEQLESTSVGHVGRRGLRVGKKAPSFSLPNLKGEEVRLDDYAGRKLLLVFTTIGCGPCDVLIPHLNELHAKHATGVLAVSNGSLEAATTWASKVHPAFPIALQQNSEVSRRYEAFATPFAFLIDEKGVVRSKGIINNWRHIRFVLNAAEEHGGQGAIHVSDS